ncbi:MAG: hypothetical protein RL764_108 [Pseudomonadota bacterium]
MKRSLISAAMMIAFSYSEMAYANNCYVIQNMDAKMLCMAKADNDPGRCQYIQNMDKRNYCMAIMKRDKGQCQYIRNSDDRNMCLAEF